MLTIGLWKGYNTNMTNYFNRGRQPSYSVFLTREQAEAMNDMARESQAPLDLSATVAAARIEVKRKLRVLVDAIRKKESRV
jgi:hypothetical protein